LGCRNDYYYITVTVDVAAAAAGATAATLQYGEKEKLHTV
jgi:hypothetical protein